jgi:MFS family permease
MTRTSKPGPSKKPRFFYGWVMLGVAILMAVATMPTQTVIVSLFNESFRVALDTDLAELSLAYTVGTILAALPLPWIGRMADRYGLRVVTAAVALACAASLVLLSRAGHIVVLGGAFFLIRFLGQGALGLLANHTIAMWFERRLGLTHSLLAITGFAGGSALLPRPVAWLITRYGWQDTLVILAGLVLALTIPAVLFVFRNKPEDIGQHLDGDAADHPHTEPGVTKPTANDPAFTLRQSLRTRAFWIIVPIMCANGLIGTALLFHMQVMLDSSGIEATEQQTAMVNQAWAIAFGVGLLLMGWLADRVLPRRLLPFGPFLMLISCVICLAGPAGWVPPEHVITVMRIGMAFYGVAMSVSVAVGNPTIARYFGRTHHGAIRGAIQMASVAATGIGPFLAGAAYELAGEDFTPILAAFAISGVPLAAASLFLRPPPPAPSPAPGGRGPG